MIFRGGRGQAHLLFAFTISSAGDWLYRLALPLLVLELTGSAFGAAAAYALEYLPYLIFTLVGGVAADRVDRLRLLIRTDLASAGIVAVLAGLLVAGLDQVWLVFLVAFVLSSARPIYHPAFQSLLPMLVPADGLARANSRVQTIDSLFMFGGPLLGVGVVAALGTTTALWLDALSFVLSAAALTRIRGVATRTAAAVSAARSRIRDDVVEAVRYLRTSRIILSGSLVMTGSAATIMIVEANLIFYVVEVRHLPLAAVGTVFAAHGLGSVLGALIAARLSQRFAPGPLIVAALLGASVCTGLLLLAGGTLAMAAAWGAAGVCVMLVVVVWFTLRQRVVPEHLLGRVVAASRTLAFAATPLGALAGAWLLAAGGGPALIMVSAAGQLVVGLVALATSLGRAHFPPPAVAADPADTPVPTGSGQVEP